MGSFDAFEEELRRLKEDAQTFAKPQSKFDPLDWPALMNREGHDVSWLVEDVWPAGRHIHVHAQRKSGKSLVLFWVAIHLAIGRDPFTQEPRTPKVVAYYDFEMTEDDVRERLEDMGVSPEALGNLHYYLHQPLPPLDTEAGGRALLEQCLAMGEEVVIIDTMSRVVQGDENSAETYMNFYRLTGQPLKSHGISLCRLDHEGYQEGRSRGSSAKGDDVDIVWQLKVQDDGMQFVRKAARVSWVAEQVTLRKSEEPSLTFTRMAPGWPEGTKEKAKELDAAEVPIDAGRHIAIRLLKAAGFSPGRTVTLNAALKYRRQKVAWP